jgi:predicted ribosome quality control (RQC) complex YloA/Tae2 family protein
MRALCSLELPILIRELKPLEGSRIGKFYDAGDSRFFLRLRKGEDKFNVQCMLPYALNTTEYVPQNPEPTSFAAAVRRRIEDAVIEAIGQLNNDRIVVMELRRGVERCKIIFELFGKGNLVITDGSMRITLVYAPHDFKDRSVKVGSDYKPPEGANLDVLDVEKVDAEIRGVQHKERDAEILPALAKSASIGKLYIEEALARAGISGDTAVQDIGSEGFERIIEHTNRVIKECAEAPAPSVYFKDGIPVDFSLCSIGKYSGLQSQRLDSLQNALDVFCNQQAPAAAKESQEAKELEKSIEKQRALIASLEAEAAGCSAGADIVMRNLHPINALINFLKQNRHATKEDAQAVAQGIKILDVNLKDKSVRIDIQ